MSQVAPINIRTNLIDNVSRPIAAVTSQMQRASAVGAQAASGIGRASATAVGGVLRLAGGVATLGGVMIGIGSGVVLASLRRAGASMRQLSRDAESLGLSAESLQGFQDAALLVEGSVDGVNEALSRLRGGLDEVELFGGGQTSLALARIGVDARDARGELRPLSDLLPEIADGLAGLSEAERRLRSRQIFGSSDSSIIDLFGSGSDNLRRQVDAARSLTGEIAAEQQRQLIELDKAADQFALAYRGLARRVRDELAPLATVVFRNLAAAAATIPDAIGNIGDAIRDSLDGDVRAQELFQNLADDTLYLLSQVGVEGARLLVVGLAEGVGRFLPLTVRLIVPTLQRTMIEAFQVTIEELSDVFGGENTVVGRSLRNLVGTVDLLGELREVSATANGASERLRFETLSAAVGVSNQIRADLEQSASVIGQAGRGVLVSLDNIARFTGGFRERLAQLTAAAAEPDTQDRGEEAITLGRRVVELFRGIEEGAVAFGRGLETVADVGVRIGRDVTATLSSDVYRGLQDVIEGTESWGDAMRRVGSNILDVIGRVVTQLLVVRALSGIFGAFGGGAAAGAAPAASSAASSVDTALSNATLAAPLLRHGGVGLGDRLIRAADAPRAADGMIFGPRPGGRLVRLAEAGQPEAVLPLRRTRSGGLGVMSEGGGGGTTVVNEYAISVTISDPGSDGGAARRGRLAARELLDAIRRDGALRDDFAGAVAATRRGRP